MLSPELKDFRVDYSGQQRVLGKRDLWSAASMGGLVQHCEGERRDSRGKGTGLQSDDDGRR